MKQRLAVIVGILAAFLVRRFRRHRSSLRWLTPVL